MEDIGAFSADKMKASQEADPKPRLQPNSEEEKIKQLESANECLKQRANRLAEALELIKDTAKCTDDRFAAMSDYIYHLCESSLNEYKTK